MGIHTAYRCARMERVRLPGVLRATENETHGAVYRTTKELVPMK